jgi:hypothetical protein
MRLRPRMRLAVALLVAVGVQGVHAAPARAMAELRAISCCAKDCHRADPLSAAKRCCVVQSSSDVATLASVAQPEPPVVAGVLPVTPTLSPAVGAAATRLSRRPPHRAGPIFLLTASLRL